MIETRLRAVFDTNIIIAALKSKNPNSPTIELLRLWQSGQFVLLYADKILNEYQEKLEAKRVDHATRITFLANLYALGEYIELESTQIQPVVVDDPDDDVFVACALVGQATHLVTYDAHLLNLGETYQGVFILDGLHFLYVVRGDAQSAE